MLLKFKNLTKDYDGRRVLDIADGAIESGGCTAVIGPNGAGKSTLINMIAGIDTPTSGTVFYGRDEDTLSEHIPFRELTLVFQKPYLISTTVEKNIIYPLKLRKWSKEAAAERCTELIDKLGLHGLEKQKSWKLSGGETQKVALARALSFKPRLLLLDEPTANVDPKGAAEIESIFKTFIEEEKISIIVITHNLAQARRIADRVLFMHEGKIIEQGDCQQVLMNPKMDETKKFVEGELLITGTDI